MRCRSRTPAGSGKPGSVQEELFATYRHHGFITNSTLSLVEADARHRDHAIVEQVIAELKDGPIAHLPSGSYAANAAWLAHAVIAFNVARTAGVLTSKRHARARWATLRTQLINVPARVATSARRLTDWPWAPDWQNLFEQRPWHLAHSSPDHPPPGATTNSKVEEPGRPALLSCPFELGHEKSPRESPKNQLTDQG